MAFSFQLLIYCGAAALVSGLFLRWLIGSASQLGLNDIPNYRSSHSRPTPRGGGVAVVIAVSAALLVYIWQNGLLDSLPLAAFWVLAAGMGLMGWLDDRFQLSRGIRIAAEALAALVVIAAVSSLPEFYLPFAGYLGLGIFGSVLAVIWIAGTVNIFNFMDGVDAMASLQALAASAGWLYMAWLWDLPVIFAINALLLVCVTVFLWFNWPPARLFMGDTGSLYLGFLFGAMPLLAAALSEQVVAGEAIWVGALLIWPSLFDGSYTILRRLFRGENIFRAHRSHLYQRLNISGWAHGRISMYYFVFSLFSVLCAILFVRGEELPVAGLQDLMAGIPGGADGQRLVILLILGFFSFLLATLVWKREKDAQEEYR